MEFLCKVYIKHVIAVCGTTFNLQVPEAKSTYREAQQRVDVVYQVSDEAEPVSGLSVLE